MTNVITSADVYRLAKGTGLDAAQATIATAIAWAESGRDADAVGDLTLMNATWGPSVGLWQIRSVKAEAGTGSSRDVTRLKNPEFNARSMYSISSGGTDWTPWSTYTNGAYREHLGRSDGPASGTVTDPEVIETGLFAGWQGDAMRIGLTVAAAGVALALLVMGVQTTVGGSS